MDHQSPDSQNPYASPAIPPGINQTSVSFNKPDEPLLQPIRTSGALSLSDYFLGVRLGQRWLRRIAMLICSAAVFFYLLAAYYPEISSGNSGIILGLILDVLIGLTIILPLRWLLRWRVRRIHDAGKGVFAHTESLLYEDHYEIQQATMTAKVMWSTFCKFRYSDRLVVLYYDGNPFQFSIIARSKFQTQHDWDCFIGLLDRKLLRC